jgi:FkbM family methyltransferase
MAEIGARVVAFEPIPEYAERLRARFPDVRVEAAAISDTDGTARFFVDTREGMNARASSLMELRDLKESGRIMPITVPTVRLDTYCEQHGFRPDFLKIDVEGCEPRVFAGSRRLIEERRPVMVFEFWESHYARYLEWFEYLDRFYRLVRLGDGREVLAFYASGSYDGPADILCLPRRG